MADCSRDYSQAVDVGTLAKGLEVGSIRILIWILGFMSFGYATAEFEVCSSPLLMRLQQKLIGGDGGETWSLQTRGTY